MLTAAAQLAGMKVPPDPDDFDPEKFPHFHVFCLLQLSRPVRVHGEHWNNAKVIADIPEDKLRTMTLGDFIEAGLEYSS